MSTTEPHPPARDDRREAPSVVAVFGIGLAGFVGLMVASAELSRSGFMR